MHTNWVQIIDSHPDFRRLLDQHHDQIADALQLVVAEEISAALDDLDSCLALAWTFRQDVDRNASVPKQRVQLKQFLRVAVTDEKALERLDTALVIRIGYHLNGGAFRLLYGSPDPAEIRRAAREALKRFPQPRRGRPSNTSSLAFRQLGLGLATVWRDHGGQVPGRRHRYGEEYGPFRDFVDLILNEICDPFQRVRTGTSQQVDHLVRTGIAEYRLAQKSGDANRIRGHLDPKAWLSGPPKKPRKRTRRGPTTIVLPRLMTLGRW